MALLQDTLGEKIVVMVGNGETSNETFAAAALINTSRSIDYSTATEESEIVDLANPSAPAQIVRRVKSSDLKIDGAGTIHLPDLYKWQQWAKGGIVKNCKIVTETSTETGAFILSSFQVTGERAKSVECQITLQPAKPTTLTANT